MVHVKFRDRHLLRLATEPAYRAGFSRDLVSRFRRLMQYIVDAPDERAFYARKALHYEKLKGARSHQRSMRINDQWRLIVELMADPGGKVVVVVSIEDYH